MRRHAARASRPLLSPGHALRISSSRVSYLCGDHASLAPSPSSILVLVVANPHRHVELLTIRSQSLVSSIAHRVCLREHVRSLHAQIPRLGCWAIFLRACPPQRAPTSPFSGMATPFKTARASTMPANSQELTNRVSKKVRV